jgi:hypothetical protein
MAPEKMVSRETSRGPSVLDVSREASPADHENTESAKQPHALKNRPVFTVT